MRSADKTTAIDWLGDVPPQVLAAICDHKIVAAGFGAGPGCMAQNFDEFTEPVCLEDGLRWLDHWASTFKRARLIFDNGVVLHFYGHSFERADLSALPPAVEA
jgi:hypothetical protein